MLRYTKVKRDQRDENYDDAHINEQRVVECALVSFLVFRQVRATGLMIRIGYGICNKLQGKRLKVKGKRLRISGSRF